MQTTEKMIFENAARRLAVFAALQWMATMAIFASGFLSADWPTLLPLVFACTGFTILAGICFRYASLTLALPVLVVTSLFVFAFPIIVSTYAAMRFNMPLMDEALYQVDLALGYERESFIRFVDARPVLAGFLGQAYTSFSLQLLAVPMLLVLMGYGRTAVRFLAAFSVACLLASLIAIWFPAYGAFAHLGIGQETLQNINIHYGYFFVQQFDAVRGDPAFLLNGQDMSGILTFPSVHASTAALLAWAAWPSRVLRWPLLILNAGMAVSALTHGSHYLIDVVASVPVVLLAIWAAPRITGLAADPITAVFSQPVPAPAAVSD